MIHLMERSLTCEEVANVLDDFLCDRLNPVMPGRVKVHILYCQECEDAYAMRIQSSIESGASIANVPVPQLPHFIAAKLREEMLGAIWNSELVRSQMVALLASLATAVQHRQRRGLPARGVGRAQRVVEAEVLDKSYQPLQEKVKFIIETEPQITGQGELMAKFSTSNLSYEGRALAFTLALPSEQKLSILARLKPASEQTQLIAEISEKRFEMKSMRIPSGIWKLYVLLE